MTQETLDPPRDKETRASGLGVIAGLLARLRRRPTPNREGYLDVGPQAGATSGGAGVDTATGTWGGTLCASPVVRSWLFSKAGKRGDMRARRALGATVAVFLSSCVLAAPAGAATTVGQAVTPSPTEGGCGPAADFVQTSVAEGASYVAPSAGVITSWTTVAGPSGPARTGLKIYRPTRTPAEYFVVAEDGLKTHAANSGPHTHPVRFPVQAGDIVGLKATGGPCTKETGVPADQIAYRLGTTPPGTAGIFTAGSPGARLSVAARLEADADRDGFGDESQDGCPTNAAVQTACPVPPPCPAGTSPGVICQTVAGVTTFLGTAGSDRIVGTAGRDVVLCGDGADTVTTGAGDDEIRCGAGADTVDAGLGNDRILGELGNDKLLGGPGDDRLGGGDDQDRLGGGSGKDTGSGGNGRDIIGGGSGNDRLNGNAGADRVSGDSGRDSVKGSSGADRLFGGSGRDRLSGGSGRDRIAGGTGRDTLAGGPGTDSTRQ